MESLHTRVSSNKRVTEVITVCCILAIASGLRIWRLEQNGWGAEYYTAAVRSMSISWHNFYFAAFDPAGFISVDKPPGALWPQVASVLLLGFRPLAVLLPQAIEGVLSVMVLYYLVRRRFGRPAASLAALFLAVTPVLVAVNRTNNTDSCLLFVLLLSAWPLLKAAEEGDRRHLFLSMLLVGLAFNVKMLAAFIVLPAFYATYLLCAPLPLRRRVFDLSVALPILMLASAPWVLSVELTPPDQRPYVGSSRHNSMLDLIVGHNAVSRFMRRTSMPPAAAVQAPSSSIEPNPAGPTEDDVAAEMRLVVTRVFVRTPPAALRLVKGQMAAQTEWLLPLALAGLILGLRRRRSNGLTVRSKLHLLFWLFWLTTYAVTYSCLGGIIHFYYLSTLAPALSALAGIGTVLAWGQYRDRLNCRNLLPGVLLLTAMWQLHVHVNAVSEEGSWSLLIRSCWLYLPCVAMVTGTLVAVLLLLTLGRRRWQPWHAFVALGIGIAAELALPLAWGMSSIAIPGNGLLPSTDLRRLVAVSSLGGRQVRSALRQSADTSRLEQFLQANRTGERFLLSTSTTQIAAPVIIHTGEPVLARGGFHGLDPAIEPAQLAALVTAGQLRFVMLDDVAPISRRMGADAVGRNLADWIRSNGVPVDPGLWRGARPRQSMTLYDMRPEKGSAKVGSSMSVPIHVGTGDETARTFASSPAHRVGS